jgi:hypothetical protein
LVDESLAAHEGHPMLRINFKELFKSEIDKAQYLLRQTTYLLEMILTSDGARMLTDRLGTKAKVEYP